jgi:hypothetical protein
MILDAHPEQLLQRLYSACVRVASDFGASDSPWERVPMEVPPTAFGPGSLCPFTRYFEGDSHVRVESIDGIVEWLQNCEYVSDLDQFHERDLWQQPCAFEQSRRGDCEDFALWAWRKLVEMGVDAEFYVGRVMCSDDPSSARAHAWVVYRVDGEFLFEPAACGRQHIIQPLPDVRDRYVPHFAVDRHFVSSAFVGCLLDAPPETASTPPASQPVVST